MYWLVDWLILLARDAFVRTNRRAIAMMFVRLFVRLSVWDGRALWSYVSTDLSLRLDSRMFWVPWHQNKSIYSQPSFSSSTWNRGGVWMCKLGVISQERSKIEVKLLLSANRKSHICRVDWHNNEWPWVTLNGSGCYLWNKLPAWLAARWMQFYQEVAEAKRAWG